nr:hypothetical protein [Tanacetum cinerariifolium]
MFGEGQAVDVVALPKFDMSSYESSMSAKDVKSLALRHGISLDLHPVALTKGWTMDQLSDDMKGLKQGYWFSFEKRVGKGDGGKYFERLFRAEGMEKEIFFLDRRAIPDVMAWRHHDLDISDHVLEDGFVVTMFEYLRFPFLSRATIEKGVAFTIRDHGAQHTVPPLPVRQPIPGKTGYQKEVEVEDPKVVATRKRKARVATKKKERKKQGGDGGEGSRLKTKQRKTACRKDGPAASEATSSLEPIRILNPNQPSGALAAIAESREDRSPRASPRDSANRSVHNYFDGHHDEEIDNLNLGSSDDQARRDLTLVNTEVIQPSLESQHVNRGPTVLMLRWEESNALNNATALERAWFSLARGSLAQTDILERFENLQTDFDRLVESHAECGDLTGKLLGKAKIEKFDCICKLLPTMVGRLLQSHKYKQSLFEPFNLAIQAGWGKGLLEERSEADLLELIGRMEGFDAYADKKMKVEYDKLFEKRYPYISCGFRHSISDLLKVYPDSPPHGQALPNKPSSEKSPSTSAPLGS